jgi:hypothetical protein
MLKQITIKIISVVKTFKPPRLTMRGFFIDQVYCIIGVILINGCRIEAKMNNPAGGCELQRKAG